MPHQYSPFTGSLLRALVNQPAEVPAGNCGGLQPLSQPSGAKRLRGDVVEDLVPCGGSRCSPLVDSSEQLLPRAGCHGQARGDSDGARS
eukprot:9692600-Alexandrium_andersonii.AAC.1